MPCQVLGPRAVASAASARRPIRHNHSSRGQQRVGSGGGVGTAGRLREKEGSTGSLEELALGRTLREQVELGQAEVGEGASAREEPCEPQPKEPKES